MDLGGAVRYDHKEPVRVKFDLDNQSHFFDA
jgi:hypothetical protein